MGYAERIGAPSAHVGVCTCYGDTRHVRVVLVEMHAGVAYTAHATYRAKNMWRVFCASFNALLAMIATWQ